jgi:hypothetical protein
VSAFGGAAFDAVAYDTTPVTLALPVRVDISALQSPSVPVIVSIVAPAIAAGTETVTDGGAVAAIWRLVVTVGGVDVSDRVLGEVTVEAEENAARIAELALHVAAGSVVTLTEWIGTPVAIWLAAADDAGAPVNALPIFTGLVDTPTLTPGSGVIGLRCTDNRQGMIAALPRDGVFSLVGGYYSAAVFDAGAPSLVLAGDLLSTMPAALDVAPGGGFRMTDWAAKVTPDLSFSDDDILDESVAFDPADRAGMVNRVTINFGYRFPRQRCEGYEIGYDRIALDMTSFGQWIKEGNYILQRAAVTAAIEKAGAAIVDITWREIPTHAVKLPGTDGYWLPNPAQHNLLCMGFGAIVTFDFNQEQQENFILTVENAASIERLGVIAEQMSGALEGVWDDPTAAEHAVLLWKKKISSIPPRSTALLSVGTISATDAELTYSSDRDAANEAMATLVAIAKTRIAAAHRRHSVSASVPANPLIDLDKTIAIDAQGVTAKGKVRRVVHRFDPDSGSAITDFTLAISAIAGVGYTHPDDDPVAPAGTEGGAGTPVGAVDITWNGLLGQDDVITITFPDVGDEDRNNKETEILQSYAAPVAEDTLEVTL